jgi:hypothetical protein
MKRVALVLAVLLVLAPLARPQEKRSASPALPIHPLAGAREGDWCVMECVLHSGNVTQRTLQRWTVAAVTSKDIQLARALGKDEMTATVPLNEPPTIESYFDMKGQEVRDVSVSDETRKLGDRELACKKVAFATTQAGGPNLNATAWLSSSVKGSGLVALSIETSVDQKKVTIHFALLGFGSKEKTEYGKTFDELSKALAEGGDGNSPAPKK